MDRMIQPKVKVTLVQGEIFIVTIGRATWFPAFSAFDLVPRKTTENLDRVGRPQDLPDAN
jgi:hypothetical protein